MMTESARVATAGTMDRNASGLVQLIIPNLFTIRSVALHTMFREYIVQGDRPNARMGRSRHAPSDATWLDVLYQPAERLG